MIPAKPEKAEGVSRGEVAEVVVLTEREVAEPANVGGVGGWVFEVLVRRVGPASEVRHEVRLSWPDYEFWSHGAAAPERVAKAVVEAAMHLAPERVLPARFDASTARRWAAGMDGRVRELVGGM